MKVTGFAIMHPGGDRPYFCHSVPSSYERPPGSKIFEFSFEVPGFGVVDGKIQAVGEELVEELEFTCPVCRSHTFGSTKRSNGVWIRNCHGYVPSTLEGMRSCTFYWSSEVDHLHMKSTGRFHPKSGVGTTATT